MLTRSRPWDSSGILIDDFRFMSGWWGFFSLFTRLWGQMMIPWESNFGFSVSSWNASSAGSWILLAARSISSVGHRRLSETRTFGILSIAATRSTCPLNIALATQREQPILLETLQIEHFQIQSVYTIFIS